MQDDQQARPWGVVTPDFWAEPAAAPDPRLAEATEWDDDDVLYEEPSAVAAVRTGPPQLPPVAAAEPSRGDTDYAGRFAALAEQLTRPQTNLALLLASSEAVQLEQELVQAFGSSDPNVIGVRELRALIAHLQGHRAAAARLYLNVTGLQAMGVGVGHPLTRANAQRTFAEWKAITDPAERAAVGREILPMLTAVAGAKAKATREVQAALGR